MCRSRHRDQGERRNLSAEGAAQSSRAQGCPSSWVKHKKEMMLRRAARAWSTLMRCRSTFVCVVVMTRSALVRLFLSGAAARRSFPAHTYTSSQAQAAVRVGCPDVDARAEDEGASSSALQLSRCAGAAAGCLPRKLATCRRCDTKGRNNTVKFGTKVLKKTYYDNNPLP